MATLSIRIDLDAGDAKGRGRLGPGKVRLLELVGETGSISAAARRLDMSYRRAWLLIDDLNQVFGEPVVAAAVGGKRGGGATLTEFGESLLARYRAIEAKAAKTVAADLAALQRAAKGLSKRR